MNNLIDTLSQLKAQYDANIAAAESSRIAQLEANRVSAMNALIDFLGKQADDLLKLLLGTREAIGRDGDRIEHLIGSDELQLAPTYFIWKSSNPNTIHRVEVCIDVHRRENISPVTDTNKVLLAMHLAYPEWKKKADEQIRAKQKEDERKRDTKISHLCYPSNFGHWCTEEDVLNTCNELRDLGKGKLADEKFALWQQNVTNHEEEMAAQAAFEEERTAARTQYDADIETWRNACRTWAETETERLWVPHQLWHVRYVPQCLSSRKLIVDDETDETIEWADVLIQSIVTLDSPDDISLHATVDSVTFDGMVVPLTISAFLDARSQSFTEPSITHSYPYHRRVSAGSYTVNVPPFILEDPTPPPTRPEQPTILQEEMLY